MTVPTLSRVFASIGNNQEGWADAMGDFISSVLPSGLIDVLSALIPPVVVGGTFCFFVIKLLRKEMAPRRTDGSLAGKDDTTRLPRSEEHTSELQSRFDLVCRLLLEKKNKQPQNYEQTYKRDIYYT